MRDEEKLRRSSHRVRERSPFGRKQATGTSCLTGKALTKSALYCLKGGDDQEMNMWRHLRNGQEIRGVINEQDKKVISLIQGDLPLDPRPFALLAEKIGMEEQALIDRILHLKRQGIIRRFGATLRHQEAGFSANAMIAWIVPGDRIDEIGDTCARFREVTHCYHRAPQKDWPYNLYTMVHGDSRDECRRIAERLSQASDVSEYIVLFSEKEFKKTSMAYFSEAHHDETL